MPTQDIYTLLNIAKSSTGTEVKQAFRRFARLHHPDLHPGDSHGEEQLKQVNAAYQNWKLMQDTLFQIRRLQRCTPGGGGFRPWQTCAAGRPVRAKFRPWRVDLWA